MDARIQILIPSYNAIDKIDATLESIRKQNYEKENIYITVVDFGSTDGTYEKLISYDSYHMGVYQNNKTKNQRQMISEIAEIIKFVRPGGCYSFHMVVYPGEILYPNCLLKCAKAMIEHQSKRPVMLIGETDIIKTDGSIYRQKPLFSEDRIIDGSKECRQYIERGYKHQIFGMKYSFMDGYYRSYGESNEARWWNKCAREGNERFVIYIKEPLAAVNEIVYEDELEEILLRWESIIVQIRIYISKFGKVFDEEFEALGKKNLAQYALWRSFLLYQMDKKKEAEDCMLIAAVIDSSVLSTEVYGKLERCILEADKECIEYLKQYFDEDSQSN